MKFLRDLVSQFSLTLNMQLQYLLGQKYFNNWRKLLSKYDNTIIWQTS